MPGNLIVINGSKDLTWYVGDSKMDKLIKYLNKVGFQKQPKKPPNKANTPDQPYRPIRVLRHHPGRKASFRM